MRKRILSLFLTLCMALSMLPAQALAAEGEALVEETFPAEDILPEEETPPVEDELPAEETPPAEDASQDEAVLLAATSGTWGNITWTVDAAGTLTISGSGSMPGSSGVVSVPWHNHSTSVKTVIIESGVTSITNHAFAQFSVLTDMEIPSGVTSIGECAFSGCSSLTSVTIPGSVTSIGDSAFSVCNKLTSVTIQEGVTSIGIYAFSSCSSLTSVTIPGSVTSIDFSAFSGCKSLMNLTIREGVTTTIGDNAFFGCSKLTSVTIPGSVASIGASAFASCESLTSLTIPEGVTTIGTAAFSSCTNLGEVAISGSVDTIGHQAFAYCKNLASVTIQEGVTTIGNNAFQNCYSLTEMTIPDSVTAIYSGAFQSCTLLKSVTLHEGLTAIGDSAFNNCSLTEVTIPDSVTSIGSKAFESCGGLTSVTIPENVASIGSYAFNQCSYLVNVTILGSPTTIEQGTFRACYRLASVTIPASVTSIGYEAFSSCSALKDIYYGGSQAQWGTIPRDSYNTSLDKATLHCALSGGENGDPLYYTDRDGNIFEFDKQTGTIIRCTANTPGVKVPRNIDGALVASIGPGAFSGCAGLTLVSLPDSVNTIGADAFSGCTNLSTIYYAGTQKQWDAAEKNGAIPAGVKVICGSSGNIITYSDAGITDGNIYFDKDTQTVVNCDPAVTQAFIPDSIEGIAVKAIGDGAFLDCAALFSVKIPDSVTSIGESAFENCGALVGVFLGHSVKSIGKSAFSNCAALFYMDNFTDKTFVNDDPNLEGDGMHVFIPDGVESIGESAFSSCSALTRVFIPDSVTSIGNGAFQGCGGLTDVTLSKSIPSIGENMFNGCGKLTDVTIPNSVTSVGRSAFQDCKSLKCVNVGGSVRSIGELAFFGCTGLESAYYPGSEQEWKQITIDGGNASLTNAWIHYGYVRNGVSDFSYQFSNSYEGFGYDEDFHIPLERYQLIFGNVLGTAIAGKGVISWGRFFKWGGNCFGMATTSAMFSQLGSGGNVKDFNSAASTPFGLSLEDKNPKWDSLTLREFIEAMQASYNDSSIQSARRGNMGKFDDICKAVSDFQATGKNPPVIVLESSKGNHALLGYALVPVSETESRLMVYDCNAPNTDRYIKFTLDGSGNCTEWYYNMSVTSTSDPIECGTKYSGSKITYIPYETYYAVWEGRSGATGASDTSEVLLVTNTKNAEIYNSNMVKIAAIENGELKTENSNNSNIVQVVHTGLTADGEYLQLDQVAVWLPVDIYTVKNTGTTASGENFRATVANVEQSASVTTTGDTVTFAVSDNSTVNYASLAGEGKKYTITLTSSLSGTIEELELSGTTASGNVSFAQISDKLYAEGAENAELTKDGNAVADKELSKATPDISTLLDSVTVKRTADAKTVRLTIGRKAVPANAVIFAAQYEEGKMKTVLKGKFNASTMEVTFGEELAGDWTFFFLDSEEKPLCSQAALS